MRFRLCTLMAAVILTGCQPRVTPSTPAGDFRALVAAGDYAGAIALVEKSSLTDSEKDGAIGDLILDGLVDPGAKTRPPYGLADGFKRLEKAARAGRVQSVSDLRGKFTTGINFEGKNSLMSPNAELAGCWERVEGGKEKADACIAMREKLKIP